MNGYQNAHPHADTNNLLKAIREEALAFINAEKPRFFPLSNTLTI